MWLGSPGGAEEHCYCDRLNQTEASGKGNPADPFRTQDPAWQETRLQVSGLGCGRVSVCPDPRIFIH